MSYSCMISFKKINAEDVPEFFVKLKKHISDNIDPIAEDDFIFSPWAKELIGTDFPNEPAEHFIYSEFIRKHSGLIDRVDAWIQRVFSYRWFYLKDIKLLGIYGLPNCTESLFDLMHGFQNSCDQDYEFDGWNGVPEFEAIANKWKNLSDEDMLKIDPHYGEPNASDLDYYRRSKCYDEIWDIIESTLFDDDSVTYIQLYGFYDSIPMKFRILTLKKYMEWKKK